MLLDPSLTLDFFWKLWDLHKNSKLISVFQFEPRLAAQHVVFLTDPAAGHQQVHAAVLDSLTFT